MDVFPFLQRNFEFHTTGIEVVKSLSDPYSFPETWTRVQNVPTYTNQPFNKHFSFLLFMFDVKFYV